MRDSYLPFSRSTTGEEEKKRILEVLDSDWLTTGPVAAEFEEAFRKYSGARSALALNSCTAGMHIALKAMDIGKGDSVVTSPLTFCSTVNVIEHIGATPILADVEVETGNISAPHVEQALDESVKALLPVHYSGLPCDMDAINGIAQKQKLFVLEDCAHAVGAEYASRKIGQNSQAASFSFYATKNITSAEGGMLVSQDEEFLERCRVLALHGLSKDAWKRYEKSGSWFYEVVAPGYKYNMPDVLAALGLEQLKKLDRINERRAAIVGVYNDSFKESPFLESFQQTSRAGTKHAHHLYPIVLRPEALTLERDRFINELSSRNIGTSVHFIPIHFHPYYKDKYGWKKGSFPNAEYLYERMISLPLYPLMSDQDVADVVSAVFEIGKKFKR